MAVQKLRRRLVLRITFSLLILILPTLAAGQVNFEKGPENTDCHLIPSSFPDVPSFVKDVRQRSYRFTQELTISRYRSPRSLEYYSCDGKTGYVVAVISDTEIKIHPTVPKEAWDELLDRNDILDFYAESFSNNYPVWEPTE